MAESTPSPQLKLYHANCHCGAVRFRTKVPEIVTVTECPCSVCFKKGYKWIVPDAGCFEIEKGDDAITGYEFGQRIVTHNFCSNCGTALFRRCKDVKRWVEIAFNARALKDFDIRKPKVIAGPNDILSLEPLYINPEFTGALPAPPGFENAHIYTGGCHCGAVTVALKTKRLLTDKPDELIVECDCSICARNGAIYIDSYAEQVTISDPYAKLKPYIFGQKLQSLEFCSICGILVYIKRLSVSAEHFKKWKPETDQGEWERGFTMNLRLMYDLDWNNIKVVKESWKNSGPEYIVPSI